MEQLGSLPPKKAEKECFINWKGYHYGYVDTGGRLFLMAHILYEL